MLAALTSLTPLAPQIKPKPLWVYHERSGIVCSPLAADLNTSEGLEVVVLSRGGEITCLGADGALLWRVSGRAEFNSEPAILDINGDKRLEVVAADREGSVVCLTGAGELLWERQLPGRTDWTSVVGPATGPGFVIVPQTDGTVTCLGPTGNVLWEEKMPSDCFSLPALGDVDSDGELESLIPSDHGFLTCLERDGTVRWRARPRKVGNAGPVCTDLNGDAKAEALCGFNDGTLFAFDGSSGQTLWTFKSAGTIDASISVADLDKDGSQEIVFTAMFERKVYCLDAQGNKRWEFETNGKVPYAAAIGDVDADGMLEVVLPDRDGFVYFLNGDGSLEHELRVEGGMNASPLLADLDGDGRIEMVLATESGVVYCFRLGRYQGPESLPWPTHRLDPAQTADATRRTPEPPDLAVRTVPYVIRTADESAAAGQAIIEIESGPFFVGTNTARATAKNLTGEKVRFLLNVTDPRGVVHSAASDSSEKSLDVELRFPLLSGGKYRLRTALQRMADRVVIARRENAYDVVLGAADRQLVANSVSRVRAAADSLRRQRPEDSDDLEARAWLLERRVRKLAKDTAALADMTWQEQREAVDFAADLRREAEEWAKVAEHSARHFRAKDVGPFVVWQSNPWETLPHLARPEGAPVNEVRVVALQGEWESVCINLSNVTSRTRALRVRPNPTPSGVKALPWDKVTIRDVTEVAVGQKEGPPLVYADFLPEADQAYYSVLPPWESRQVWLTIDTRGLEPDEYFLPLVVAEVAPELSGETITLALRVRPVALPKTNPFQSCWWSYRWWDLHPRWAIFQADHYINLFPGVSIPLGEFDDEGDMVKPPDFAQVDAYVKLRRSAGQARFLFNEPFISLPDGFEMEEVALIAGRLVDMKPGARKMYAQWLPLVVEHLKGLGLGYGDWAFYPIDEPDRSRTCLIASLSRAAKQVDPDVRFYIDFISGRDVYDLDLILPYVDLWCPQPDFAFSTKWGREVVRRVRDAGKEMVCYGILGVTSTWRPYRLMPWQCAKYGLTGAGGWVFINQAYGMWPGDPAGGDGHSATAGWDTLYPSKRLEAYREGVEDYLYLYLLAQFSERAAAAGLQQEAKQALALRQEAIEAVVDSDGGYEKIDHYRLLIGDAIESLAARLQ